MTLLAAVQPFAGAELLGFLAARAVPGLERVDLAAATYAREGVCARVTPDGLEVLAARAGDDLRRLARLFALDAEPAPWADPPGLRVPGCWDGWELAARAVLGQQVSVAGARTTAARLVRDGTWPSPGDLARRALPGMPRARARALRALAAAALDLSPAADPVATRAALLALPGIGPWTADYVLMRALAHPDVLLATDLVVRRALAQLDHDGDRWRPYRSTATVALWRAAA